MKIRYKKTNGIWKKCYAYTKEEANELGIEYKDLRCKEYSEYVITDDDYVVKCIYKKEYPEGHGNQLYTKTEFGSIFYRQKLLIDREIVPYAVHVMKRTLRRPEFPLVVDYIVDSMLSGKKVKPETVTNILNLKVKNPKAVWKNMMNTPEVRQAVQKSLSERLDDMGVNEQKVISLIEDAVEIGKTKKNGFVILKAAELMGKYLGMDAKTVIKESHSTDGEGNIARILKEISIEG